jgi:hypothetical protein
MHVLDRIARRTVRVQCPTLPLPCRNWQGSKTPAGYGQIWLDGRAQYVHRVSFALHHGYDAAGDVDHLCHNPSCWEPTHLRDLSPSANRSEGAQYRWKLWRDIKAADGRLDALLAKE